MKGQAKTLVPAMFGIFILLLTGISGYVSQSGEQQAQAETPSIREAQAFGHPELTKAMQTDAAAAAAELGAGIAADLAVDIRPDSTRQLAYADIDANERS